MVERKGDLPFDGGSPFLLLDKGQNGLFFKEHIFKGKVFHRGSIRKYSGIHQRASKIWYNMNRFMDFIPFRPDVMKWRPLRIFES